tara:strand:- start:836 stop:1123 length:288 start_codon:yes stop_codon:yes gene_type:complete
MAKTKRIKKVEIKIDGDWCVGYRLFQNDRLGLILVPWEKHYSICFAYSVNSRRTKYELSDENAPFITCYPKKLNTTIKRMCSFICNKMPENRNKL